MLRQGVGVVAVISLHIAWRCRRHEVCLQSLQAPRKIMYSGAVSGKALLDSTPSVVR